MLIRRYLRLLAVVDTPEEIVAITFTRKAAAEMRNRIIEALESAESTEAGSSNDQHTNAQVRRQLAILVLNRDKELGWQLTRNPARMRIQTIDSFCAVLTRQMPLLSKLGGQPEIIEDAEDLYREAAANTLKQLDDSASEDGGQPGGDAGWSAAVEALLEHLDNDLPRARDMLAGMLRKRDQWLRHLVGQRPDRKSLEGALRHIVETTLDFVLEALPQEFLPEFTDCLRFATQNLTESPYIIEELPGASAAELQRWQFITSLCLTGKVTGVNG